MEFLDIRDKNGNPTGEVKERSLVHADGDIHGTSHVWIVRKNEKGSYDLLLQKRSENKDAFPGCYDISSAGHLPAGQDYLSSALRELEEELGIKAKPEQLHFMGLHEGCCEETFYGKPFKNHEISHPVIGDPVQPETLQKPRAESASPLLLKQIGRQRYQPPDGIQDIVTEGKQEGFHLTSQAIGRTAAYFSRTGGYPPDSGRQFPRRLPFRYPSPPALPQ